MSGIRSIVTAAIISHRWAIEEIYDTAGKHVTELKQKVAVVWQRVSLYSMSDTQLRDFEKASQGFDRDCRKMLRRKLFIGPKALRADMQRRFLRVHYDLVELHNQADDIAKANSRPAQSATST